ncbi:MAG: hypothetical protein MO846_03990 [Candidatus Devosia symbiotica]|nr:hypothetical protein [Candidatus Devosia symbiotica]
MRDGFRIEAEFGEIAPSLSTEKLASDTDCITQPGRRQREQLQSPMMASQWHWL